MRKDPTYQEFQIDGKTIFVPEQYWSVDGPVDSINYILVVENGKVSIVTSGKVKVVPDLIRLVKATAGIGSDKDG